MRATTTTCPGSRSTSSRRPSGRLDSHNRWTGRRGLDNLYNGWSWYTPTGWYRESNSTDNLRNCSTARALTKAVYRNATFCGALAQITAEHKKTHFEGLTNGRWSWLKVTDKGGICASAITEQVVVVTP